MLIVHALGAVVVATGLVLFTLDQRTTTGTHDAAALKAWKIELGGPSSLILILIGSVIFMYPFTPWAPDDRPPVTTTTSSTTTTMLPSVSLIEPTVIEAIPGAPTDWYWIDYEPEWCGTEAYAWTPADDYANWWIIPIEAYDHDGNLIASWETESTVPLLCQWEIETEGAAYYWLWPHGVTASGIHGDWYWFEIWLTP